MNEFTLFKTFTDSDSAQPTLDALTEAGVAVQLDDTRLLYSNVLQQQPALPEVRVLVPTAELARAHALLETQAASGDMPDDHYLHQFSDAELLDLVAKPDEWSAHDHLWAQQLLAARGRELSAPEVRALRQVRIDQLATHKPLPTGWLVVGWTAAALGGPLGILVGWNFHASTTLLPDGRKVHTYAPESRKQGLWMMGLGAASSLVGLLYKLLGI